MADNMDDPITKLEGQLEGLPQWMVAEFHKVAPVAAELLSEANFETWAAKGISLANQSSRSWEASADYLRASPDVLKALRFHHFLNWVEWGEMLCADSPMLCSAFFKATPGVAPFLAPYEIGAWAKLGKSLYKGTWRSGSLASSFFEASPQLVSSLGMDEIEQLVQFLDKLAIYSYEVASECLAISGEVFKHVERRDRRRFLQMAPLLAEANWNEARECLAACPKALGRVQRDERSRFLSQVERTAKTGAKHTLSFLIEGSRAFGEIDQDLHQRLLDLSDQLLSTSPLAAIEFLKSCPVILSKTKLVNLERWWEEGLSLSRTGEEGSVAYFRMESAHSEEVLERLSSSVELDRVREVLRLYCRALTGKDVEVLPVKELTERGIGWTSPDSASTEGSAVFLAPAAEQYATKEKNFVWYKVVTTHQAAHLEFGSFDFAFEKESALFPNLRNDLVAKKNGNGNVVDLEKFFDLFEDRRLATDIFTIVEDSRVDHTVKREYKGIRSSYLEIQQDALAHRPTLNGLPLKELLLELMVRLSLDESDGLRIPGVIKKQVQAAAHLVKMASQAKATPEDSAEATIRLYSILSQLPNIALPPEEWEPIDMDFDEMSAEFLEDMAGDQGFEMPHSSFMNKEQLPYNSPRNVEFRGEFKPELVQLISKVRQNKSQDGGKATPLSQEQLEALFDKSAEIDISEMAQGQMDESSGMFVSNIMKEAATVQDDQDPIWEKPNLAKGNAARGEALEKDEPAAFLYNEWDFRARDYKPRWCRVRQKTLEEGEVEFYDKTLEAYAGLANQVKKQFEMINPETLRKVKRLPDGEEFDLDAVIEALVESKVGISPSEKLYWRRNKAQRDVAVVFLLDMSASTAEAIDEERQRMDDRSLPDDPRQYIAWLRTQRQGGGTRTYKRIIDVEKESIVLLIRALETIGDTYGIYGFSGYGRENVEFYVIKDIEDSFSDKVKKRIDKIAPVHATRMGAAIRHAIYKLDAREAKTKILFLISDGRPQDHGYSRDGMEKEHALHDTKMALLEAKRAGITPFCLTVDKAGHDYLKTMCQDVAYEVVSEIDSLPKRLPALYRKLTA